MDSRKKSKSLEDGIDFTNLHGKVMTLKETKFKVIEKFGEITKGLPDYFEINKSFDEEGNLLEETGNDPDYGIIYKLTYKYDDEGNQIEESNYDRLGNLRSITKRIVDGDKGYRFKQNEYDSKGILTSKETVIYDENGHLVERNWYQEDGSIKTKFKYTYNDKGNQVEWKGEGGIFKDSKVRYDSFDDKGNPLSKTIYKSGKLKSYLQYKYEFDQNNNWIRKIEFKNDVPQFITERIIEYY